MTLNLPSIFIPVIIPTFNLMVFCALGFYLWVLIKQKKQLEKQESELKNKQQQVESGYQQIINSALTKERAILESATQKATSILSNAQIIANTSKDTLDKAIQQMTLDVQKQASTSSNEFLNNYKTILGQVSEKSLVNFQNTLKNFESDTQKQVQQFRQSMIPAIQKELEEYKNQRFSEADKKINSIIQEVSKKVLNKSITTEDHQKLIIESLEKSKKEGIFD